MHSGDLQAELDASTAQAAVAEVVASWITNGAVADIASTNTEELLSPLVEAFVNQEGSWFFTGGDEEHGESAWAANAQRLMVEPLPDGYTVVRTANEHRLLTDEEGIP